MNPLRRIFHSTALLGLAALGTRALGQTQSYVPKTKTINAAVLLLDADKPASSNAQTYLYGQTAAPFAFYNLDRATGIKPDGWNFNNPYSPGIVTQEIRNRFGEIYGQSGTTPYNATSFPVPEVGTHVTKSEAPFWTVRLSQLSESQISNYNVLLIAPRYYLSLNPRERDILRRFVDGGGVLWVDLGAASSKAGVDEANNLPYAVESFTNSISDVYRNAQSGLLDAVRQVSDYDLTQLNQAQPDARSTGTGFYLGSTYLNNKRTNDLALGSEFSRYRPIVNLNVNNAVLPVVAEARIGDGAIVVTARGAAEILNRGAQTATNAAIEYGTNPTVSNRAFQGATPRFDAQARAAAKLAINLTTLGGDGLQPSGSPRKTSGASGDTPAPVLSRFNTEQPSGAGSTYGPGGVLTYGVAPNAPPVTYKGLIVETVGNRIVVMDAIPGRDLDGDGDPDDGISNSAGNTDFSLRDTSVGQPLDIVWVSQDLGSQLSAPVCASVPEANPIVSFGGTPLGAGATDQILVTDANGRLHIFALNQLSSNFRFVGGIHNEIGTSGGLGPPGGGTHANDGIVPLGTPAPPIPPVVVDGLAYVSDSVQGSPNTGRVWVVDLATGKPVRTTNGATTNDWYLGSSLGLPGPTAEPTIGYIPINDNSGGVDRVLYTPGIYGSSLTGTQPGFASVWIGAKGENPDSWTYDDTAHTLTITTRAGAAGGVPVYGPPANSSEPIRQMMPHVTIVDITTGDPLLDSNWIVDGGPTGNTNGVLTYQTNPSRTATDWASTNVAIRIDYTIDWGFAPTSPSAQIVRGALRLPIAKNGLTAPDSSKRIFGPIALTARGTMHMVEGTPGSSSIAPSTTQGGDSYFAIREDAGLRGQFRVVSRYTLYNGYTQTFGGSPTGTFVPPVFEDNDGVQDNFPNAIRNDGKFNVFRNFHFAGGVSVHNGVAFTAINAKRDVGGTTVVGIDTAMVAAFRAEPETPELRLGASLPANPWITQVDWARSTPGATVRSPATSTLSGNSVVVDTDNGVLRLENLATVVNGEIQDCLSLSQPIGLGASAQTMTFRQPDAVGDRWSPLLWFGLWNGGKATGTPFVGNNSVFVPAQTVLPSLFNSNFDFSKIKNSGVVWEVDGDSPTSGDYVTTLAASNTVQGNRPWINQQVQLNRGKLGQSDYASPYFRMPQNVGVTSFDDYKSRLNQTQLGTSTQITGLGGGDGIVTAATDSGAFGLTRADLVVCDEGRLLQVDSSGNPVQNTFGARFSGVGNGGSVENQRGLPRPVKAYPVGTSDSLVVDAGGNRVMRIGGDGTVYRSVERILLDPSYKPAAFRVGEPLTLNDPRDATTFEGYVYKGAQEVVTAQRPVEYWIHYLVADSGNHRLVELADRFEVGSNGQVLKPITTDLNGNPLQVPDPETGVVQRDNGGNIVPVAQVGVLVWQSPSLEGAANVGDFYNSISRIYLGDTTSGRYVYVAGVSRTRPTSLSAGLDKPNGAASLAAGGGGAVVVFDPIGGTHVFDRMSLPNTGGATLFQPQATAAYPVAAYSPIGTFTTGNSPPAQNNRPFRGVQAVTAAPFTSNNKVYARVMVTDENAVYEFLMDSNTLATVGASPALAPDWMISETAFTALRSTLNTSTNLYDVSNNPLSFRPTYARRLDSGEILLVNGYTGLMRDRVTAYTGEVTLLDGLGFVTTATADPTTRNLGFTFNNVRLTLRSLTGIRGLVSPVFADRR